MFARRLVPEPVIHSFRSGRVEEGNSSMVIPLGRVEPFIPGGTVTDRRPVGVMQATCLSGAAALGAMELARADREQSEAEAARHRRRW